MKLAVLAAAAASIALSGCAGLNSATPAQLGELVDHLAAAGCKGTITVDVGAETGQLGGGAHASNTFNGSCDPANVAPKVVPPAG